MLRFDYALLMTLAGAGLLLAGYWLAAALRGADTSPGERLAVAMLGGLASLLFTVSVVNFFQPIAGLPAWLCLLPCGITLVHGPTRRALLADLRAVWAQSRAGWLALAGAAFLALTIWPLLRDPELVFFEGHSNHDNFFWVAGASYLTDHNYMQAPELNAAQPFPNLAVANAGWRPDWGRMGAEGLLALLSAVSGVTILRLYNFAVAVLMLPWISAVYLVLRTFFVRERPGFGVLLAAVGLQPIFLFFYSNANLPNLLGAVASAGLTVATERSLRCCREPVAERTPRTRWSTFARPFWVWWIFLVLCFHGTLCSYPEVAPFALVPCGLLWLRAWGAAGARAGWRGALVVVAAFLVGMCINPATTVRACNGFLASFHSARVREWKNLFGELRPTEYIPAVITLAIPACRQLGVVLGVVLSGGLIALLGRTLRRARDPFGAVALFAGSGVLLIYTWVTAFPYGWQKMAQFAGVFLAAVFPAAGLATLGRRGALLPRLGAGALVVFFTYATLSNFAVSYHNSERKFITREMLALRQVSRLRLAAAPVLVVSESFSNAFFYGMWATYFFPGSSLLFSPRGTEGGGYLRERLRFETPGDTPPPAAVFVSHDWAETFDLNSRRLIDGVHFALLEKTNRVEDLTGFSPDNGVPRFCAPRATLRLIPHRDAWLHLLVRPRASDDAAEIVAELTTENRVEGESAPRRATLGRTPPPWEIVLPLRGTVRNEIGLVVNTSTPLQGELPFEISALRITDEP